MIDTKSRGFIYGPSNPVNKPLYEFLEKHQAALDGSRLYEDLIDIYLSQEFDLKEEKTHESINRAV